jgi:hypothetical protein
MRFELKITQKKGKKKATQMSGLENNMQKIIYQIR